jgi:hypothetical protein
MRLGREVEAAKEDCGREQAAGEGPWSRAVGMSVGRGAGGTNG